MTSNVGIINYIFHEAEENCTWFELVELVVLPLPAPDAPDALAADDASADGAGDSPCCDVPATGVKAIEYIEMVKQHPNSIWLTC